MEVIERLGERFMDKSEHQLKVVLYIETKVALNKKAEVRLKVNCIERLGERFMNKSESRLKVDYI